MEYQVSFPTKTWYLHTWRYHCYKISLLVLKNISLARYTHSWNVFEHSKRNFVFLRGHVISSICHHVLMFYAESECGWSQCTSDRRPFWCYHSTSSITGMLLHAVQLADLSANCFCCDVCNYNFLWFSILKTTPKASFTAEETEKLTDRIQNAGTEVVNAKAGSVSVALCFFFRHTNSLPL